MQGPRIACESCGIWETAMNRVLSVVLLVCAVASSSTAFAAEINYEYNSKGQLVTARYADGTVVTYQYDGNGNRTSVTSSGGPDIKAPTTPLVPVATAVSSTRIDVSWSA